MSRQLPARPNLDHLRKQAKALLADLLRRDPETRLADALHAVAREYGFASWPKLKAHVRAARLEARPAAPWSPLSPFVGRWVADVARSTRHPANQFQRAVVEFAVAGDAVTVTYGFVEDSGQRQHGAATIRADGREHATDNGYALTAEWHGPHVLETVATRDGQVVGRGRYEVSADGATLTISAPEQVVVLARG